MIDPSALVFPTWALKSTYSAQSFPDNLIYIPYDREEDRGARFPALLLRCSQPTRYLILYFHGNAEDLGAVFPFLQDLQSTLTCHAMAVEYPGYGICPGHPTADRVVRQGHATMKVIRDVLRWPLDSVILLGRSVGTAPAVKMAAAWPIHGQCLLSPFSSVQEVGKLRFGRWTENLVSINYLNSERSMAKVKVPTLIIHGKSDQDIPPDHARRLFEACSSAKKFLVCPSRLDHNTNVLADPAFFFNPMVKFFSLPGGRPLGPQTELRPLPLRFFSPSESPPIERSPRAVCRVGGETLSNLLAAEIETETRTVPHSLTEEEAASVGVQSDDAEVEEPSLESPPSPEGVALPLPGQGGATAGSKEKKGFWGVLVDFVQRGVRFVLGLGF